MSVAAAVVPHACVPAAVALLDVAPEGRGPAPLNGAHDPSLSSRERGTDLVTIDIAVAAEDLRYGQRRAIHRPAPSDQKCWGGRDGAGGARGRGSKSSGLDVEQTLLVAMRKYRAVVARLRWPSSN